MGLFGPPDVEKMKIRRDVQGLIKTLAYKPKSYKSKDINARRSAARALGELKETQALGPLIVALENVYIREDAVLALGEMGDKAAIPPLTARLDYKNDYSETANKAIVEALGKIGAPAVETLGLLLKNRENAVIYKAVLEALTGIGEPAIDMLIGVLESNLDMRQRSDAADVLGKIKSPRSVPSLIASMNDREQWVREAAAESLKQIGWDPGNNEDGARYWIVRNRLDNCVPIGAPAVGPLVAVLEDYYGHHKEAIEALVKIGSPAVEPLIAALQKWDGRPCAAAAQTLGRIGDRRAVEPLLARLGGSYEERTAASSALEDLKWKPGMDENGARYWIITGEVERCVAIGRPAVKQLIAAMDDDGNKSVQEKVFSALVKIGAPAVEPLIAVVKDTHSRGLRSAVAILGLIGDLRAVQTLVAALGERRDNVDIAAARALDHLKWEPGSDEGGALYWIAREEWEKCVAIGLPAVKPLIGCLGVERFQKRLKAAEALRTLYRQGSLDLEARQKILAQRASMAASHVDELRDVGCEGDFSHTDQGIGVDL
jgi:HEAT repeat protein